MLPGEKLSLSQNDYLNSWQIVTISAHKSFGSIFGSALKTHFFDKLFLIQSFHTISELIPFLQNAETIFLQIDASAGEKELNNFANLLSDPVFEFKGFIHTTLWIKTIELSKFQDHLQSNLIDDLRFIENLNPQFIQTISTLVFKSCFCNFSLYNEYSPEIGSKVDQLIKNNKKLQELIGQSTLEQKRLHNERILIEQQSLSVEARNTELEKAFKKSSINHIKLQKTFRENELQRQKLEELLAELQEKNQTMETQFHEIMTQRNYIEQQHEEIQSQRDMALKQRDKIAEQQEEINDNIQYASRIQQALFPQKELMDALLPKHFVLNKPKDVVSGDFYWISQNRSKTVVAVSDCTGHGISGAMMSMLGTAFLNEIINKNDVTNSSLVLEQLRERVISTLHQDISKNIEYSRDGMDISVCILDIIDYSLEYSGANNPIYLIRNGELFEYKADKMPIGIHEFYNEPFHTHKIELIIGDSIYMFSDGFADQFGGSKGKKLKYKNFKNILVELEQTPLENRSSKLNKIFEDWRGEQEQIDDVLVIGFTIV
jgi:serine phosphatase RsbU (regulator of sigma subunit)